MRWSQLRTQLEALRAPSVRARVDLHQARYRWAREEEARIWLTVDGEDVASFSTAVYQRRRVELAQELERAADGSPGDASAERDTHLRWDDQAREQLRLSGDYGDDPALVDLKAYLSMPVDEALASPVPLLRALAVVDRRVGRRRIVDLANADDEHPLVRMLLRVRCEAEGILPDRPTV